MTTRFLKLDLKLDEGRALTAYQDTVGIWTVGYGHAHVPPGTVWTPERAEEVLDEDIARACYDLDQRAAWWRMMDDVRQDVLANMCFNMGWPTLSGFRNTLAYMKQGDYESAAKGMLASKWARQVKGRAKRLAEQMRTGVRISR